MAAPRGARAGRCGAARCSLAAGPARRPPRPRAGPHGGETAALGGSDEPRARRGTCLLPGPAAGAGGYRPPGGGPALGRLQPAPGRHPPASALQPVLPLTASRCCSCYCLCLQSVRAAGLRRGSPSHGVFAWASSGGQIGFAARSECCSAARRRGDRLSAAPGCCTGHPALQAVGSWGSQSPLPAVLTARNARRNPCSSCSMCFKPGQSWQGHAGECGGGELRRCSRRAGNRPSATGGSSRGAHLALVLSRAWAGQQPWGQCRHPTGCPLPLFPPAGQAGWDSISLLAGLSVPVLIQGFCMRE